MAIWSRGWLVLSLHKNMQMQMSIKASVVTQDLEYMDWEEPRSVLSYMMWARLLGEVMLDLQSRSQLKNETHSLAQPGYWDSLR